MRLAVEERHGVGIVAVLTDRLEASNAPLLKEQLAPIQEQFPRLVLDLNQVEFVDSTGCGSILSAVKTAANLNGDVKICRVSPYVKTTFQMIRLHRICDILETADEAVAAFNNTLS